MGNTGAKGATVTKPNTSSSTVDDESFTEALKLNLTRLVVYAEGANPALQREVAERLANEAVRADRQKQIVEHGGLKLLVPLTRSLEPEVRGLAAHALANLSVHPDNIAAMAAPENLPLLVSLLGDTHQHSQRQAAKAIANLGAHPEHKVAITEAGALPPLVKLINSPVDVIKIEAIAAIANLAVNDRNEVEIAALGAIPLLITTASGADHPEVLAQCARALRNLSVNKANKQIVKDADGVVVLQNLVRHPMDRVHSQAARALANLGEPVPSSSTGGVVAPSPDRPLSLDAPPA